MLLLFVPLCAAFIFQAAVGDSSYTNPVLSGDWPDPGVIMFNDLWFAATTGVGPANQHFAVHQSADLAKWTFAGYLFNATTWPSWADGTSWAPEVHFIPSSGKHVVYFVSRLAATGALVVGAAESTSSSPLGPFVDRGSPLILAPPGACYGVIDPTFYWDAAAGVPYVIYKHDGNSCSQPTNVYAARLTPDGLSLSGGAPTLLITDDSEWEHGITEAPWVMRNASTGDLFLFYSGASYNQPTYALGVARSSNGTIEGSWQKYSSNPVLHSAPGAGKKGSSLHYGPGHCSVVAAGASGDWAFVYAAEQPGGSARNLMLDAVAWTPDGWPIGAHGEEPSSIPEPVPQ